MTKITAFMNNPRRWHGMKVSDYLPKQPVPDTLDWDTWLATAQFHEYNKGYINGEWRSWYDFGNGALGEWGAHIFDTAHQFLNLGLPTEVDPLLLEGHSPFIFPQASTLAFRFPARGAMPPVKLTWYDGVKNLPSLPENIGAAVVDSDIPPPSTGKAETKARPPGKVIYGGSLASTLQILGPKAAEMKSSLPEIPKSPSNHFKNFLLACKGQETCRSSFAVAGPLCQSMALGVLALRVNAKLVFDPASKQITNHKVANELLAGAPPRKEWEQFFKLRSAVGARFKSNFLAVGSFRGAGQAVTSPRMAAASLTRNCSAILVAAGSSRRMGFDKLASPLAGIPVLRRTLNAFLAADSIAEIVVVCPAERWELVGGGFSKPVRRVDGGTDRQDSVVAGLAALSAQTDLVAVHDGARPLVAAADIDRCVAAAVEFRAAALARRVTETLKRSDAADFSAGAVSRENLWFMETPQVFNVPLLLEAYEAVAAQGLAVTDEVSAIEAIGVQVKFIESIQPNLKITTPADLALAEALLR